MSKKFKSLEEQLGEDDWAVIIGKEGELKGLYIPHGKDEDEVPTSILYIMENYFGLNFSEDEDSSIGKTLH